MQMTELVAMIEAAFSGLSNVDGLTLAEAALVDQGIHRQVPDREFDAARATDDVHDWRLVPQQVLSDCCGFMSHLEPEAWRYYLPALMLFCLKNEYSSGFDLDAMTSLLFQLDHGKAANSVDMYRLAKFYALDEKQIAAVRAFLEYLLAEKLLDEGLAETAESALKKFWGLPENQRPRADWVILS